MARALACVGSALEGSREHLDRFDTTSQYLPAVEADYAETAEGTAQKEKLDGILYSEQVHASDVTRALLASLETTIARLTKARNDLAALLAAAAAAELPAEVEAA